MLCSLNLKRTCDQNFTLFYGMVCQFYTERALYKILWRLFVRFDEVIKLQTAEFSEIDIILTDVQNISNLTFFAFFC